jgi:hypothetical protein
MRKSIFRTFISMLTACAVILWLSIPLAFGAGQQPQGKPTPPAKASADTAKAPTSGGPKIFFPEESFDFGTVARGSVNEHVFKVRNTGNAPLTLIKAAAG